MAESISRAVEQIKSTGLLRSLDESATKQGVVLKLLYLAGWNTFDVSEVVPEYTVGNLRVDFALRPGTANAVFIEVKRPGENLESHQQQLLEYCFQEGTELAVLTNGRTWWLYLPLQRGNWDQRRFLTIDLESQDSAIIEQRFMEYLSQEKVISGRAVSDAENSVRSQQRAEIINKTMIEAWNQIVEIPDEFLVDLVVETTERICGMKPEPEIVKQFLLRRISPRLVLNREADVSSAKQTNWAGKGSTLPITLNPQNSEDFKAALLHTKEAWLEVSYRDGRKEVRRWDASRMRPSSNVISNIRSKSDFRPGNWQGKGIVSLRVSIERPTSEDS